MAFLSRHSVMEALSNIKNGRLARICYQVEIPVKAKYRDAGIKVYKTVEKTVRIGVFYGNIASVKAKTLANAFEQAPLKKESPFEWVVPNRIRKHKTNGKEYLQVAYLKKGQHKKENFTVYFYDQIVEVPDKQTFEEYNFHEYVLPSRWTYNDKEPTEVQFVSLNNIIRINDVGDKVTFY